MAQDSHSLILAQREEFVRLRALLFKFEPLSEEDKRRAQEAVETLKEEMGVDDKVHLLPRRREREDADPLAKDFYALALGTAPITFDSPYPDQNAAWIASLQEGNNKILTNADTIVAAFEEKYGSDFPQLIADIKQKIAGKDIPDRLN